MERKTFLWLSVATTAALSLPTLGCNDGNKTSKALRDPEVLSKCVEEKTILQVGRTYRKLYPGEDNRTTLESLLTGNNNATNLKQLMEDKVQEDFKNSQLVQVEGWILSVTEARQCALYSLVQQD